MRSAAAGALLLALAALSAGGARAGANDAPSPPGRASAQAWFSQIDGDRAEPLDAEWWLPTEVNPSALLLLQHGFARRCANLRPLLQALAEADLAVVCVNADMARGAPGLARQWAARLGQGAPDFRLPDGRALPATWITAGHSAGGAWAVRMAAALRRGPAAASLAGVLLLDPVSGGADFDPALASLLDADARTGAPPVPVKVLAAEPGRCNVQGRTTESMSTRAGPLRIERWPGSTHVDAEGEATDTLAVMACGQGPPTEALIARTQAWMVLSARQIVDDASRKGKASRSNASGASSGM